MNRVARIEARLREAFRIDHLEVIDESHGHRRRADDASHVRVIIVSADFAAMAPLARHRAVNAALADELAGGLHALAIEARTPAQWAEAGGPTLDAPPCHGGSRS